MRRLLRRQSLTSNPPQTQQPRTNCRSATSLNRQGSLMLRMTQVSSSEAAGRWGREAAGEDEESPVTTPPCGGSPCIHIVMVWFCAKFSPP